MLKGRPPISVNSVEKGLAADLHAQTLALPQVMSLAVFFIFYFVLSIYESLFIQHKSYYICCINLNLKKITLVTL